MRILGRSRVYAGLSGLGTYSRDLTAIIVGIIVLLLLMALGDQAGPLRVLRVLLGLVCVLVVPGYCVVEALFPRKTSLDTPARLGLSLAVSFGIVPLLALLLDRTPWGIRPWPIFATEMLVCLGAGVIAVWRRLRQPTGDAVQPTLDPRPWWSALAPGRRMIFGLVGIALTIFAFILTAILMLPSAGEQAAEFYLLGPEGGARDFPRNPIVGESLSVIAGVANHRARPSEYRAELWVNDSWHPERRALLLEVDPFVVAAGQSDELLLRWTMLWPGPEQHVEILLYDTQIAEPIRRLRLVLDVATADSDQSSSAGGGRSLR